ncbi:MFS family permease [Catenulispora sp. GP43]|uniref:MFS transporter n=1 Tax=Catenulispora sp. GP43 TaxID=3156263 RepID=UPI0035145F64
MTKTIMSESGSGPNQMTTATAGGTATLTPPRHQRTPVAADAPAGNRRSGLILATVLVGYFMALLDGSIVNVALPSIREKLHATGASLQLVAAGYIIAYAVLLVTGARLGRILGHERLFKAGLAGFTIASLACGLAQNSGELIVFRVIQGITAAIMLPQVLSLIQQNFQGEARAKAMSAWTAVLASGIVVGQVLGGVLVTANLFGWSWRPVFLVNVPIGIVLYIAAIRSLPSVKPQNTAAGNKVDLAGVLTLSPTILALVVPLVLGHDEHWPIWGWVLLAATVPLLALFLAVERRVARRGTSPILPGRILSMSGMKPSLIVIFLVMVVYAGNLFATAIHLQGALGFSALKTGLAFAPCAASFGLVSYFWRNIPAHLVRRLSVIGLLIGAASMAAQIWMFKDGGYGGLWFYLNQMVFGFGIGIGNAPTMTLALMRVPVADAADASGTLATNAQLAQVVGIASLGTLYLTVAAGHAVHSAGHAMAYLSGAGVVVTLVAVAFSFHLYRLDKHERAATAAAAATV